MIDSLKKLV